MGDHVATKSTSTQTQYPWRATVRTVFAAVVAFSAMYPLIVATLGLDANIEWVGTSILVTGYITKVMAMPKVDQFIRDYLPLLAPEPKQ